MKKEWERVTKMCDYTQLPAELRAPVEKKLEEMEESLDPLFCIQTDSTQLKSGLFSGKQKVVRIADIVTPRWLVQSVDTGDGKTKPYAVFLYLDKMEISSNTVKLAQQIGMDDFGIDVLSLRHGNAERGSMFIGLQQGAVAREFIATLEQAVKKQ